MRSAQYKLPDQIGMDYKMSSSHLLIFGVIFSAAVICVVKYHSLGALADTFGLFQKSQKAETASGGTSATGGAGSARRRRQSTDIGDESPNTYEVRSSRYLEQYKFPGHGC